MDHRGVICRSQHFQSSRDARLLCFGCSLFVLGDSPTPNPQPTPTLAFDLVCINFIMRPIWWSWIAPKAMDRHGRRPTWPYANEVSRTPHRVSHRMQMTPAPRSYPVSHLESERFPCHIVCLVCKIGVLLFVPFGPQCGRRHFTPPLSVSLTSFGFAFLLSSSFPLVSVFFCYRLQFCNIDLMESTTCRFHSLPEFTITATFNKANKRPLGGPTHTNRMQIGRPGMQMKGPLAR